MDDSVGYWFVQPHPTQPTWTRLYYSVDVKMSSWVPDFIQTIIRDEGLERVTHWVKVESEKMQAKTPPLPKTKKAARP